MNEPKNSDREVDLLQYQGNSFPRVLRLVWTILLIFCVVYLVRYMLPDLRIWLAK